MNHIKKFPKNTKGRDFFTTDIHGCFDLLHEQMRNCAFDTTKDRLFVGGDNCDRGPDSCYVLEYLSEPWYHSVRGNHEEMVIAVNEIVDQQSINMLFHNGGQWYFLEQYEKQRVIYEAFKALPLAIELESRSGKKIGIIHAEVPYKDWKSFSEITTPELEWSGQAVAQWARTKYAKQDVSIIKNIDEVYVGHTPTNTGEVEQLGNVFYSDAGSFFRDKINFLELL